MREAILGGLSTGEVQLVSSVGVLTEGFDCPAAEVCILARPTKSLGLYLQMVGRVLRPAAGKERALIHDHAGEHPAACLPDDERDYSPLVTPRRVIDLRTCTDCGYLASAWRPDGTCPKCGSLQQQPIDERICQSCGQSFRGAGSARIADTSRRPARRMASMANASAASRSRRCALASQALPLRD
jgi:superfamily II DNA or RNA helicase